MSTFTDKLNKIKSMVVSGYDTDSLLHEIESLEKYNDEDKPWCEYLPDENVFLVEWEDEEYRFKKPRGERNE